MTEKKKSPTTTGAQRGKVKGEGTVAPATKANETDRDLSNAWDAGHLASQRGAPTKPPLGYSDAEVKAWYAGYKAHANPQTGEPVEGITEGYRKDY